MTASTTTPNPGRAAAALGLVLLAACGPVTIQQARLTEPAPCTDPIYVRLDRQHPGSLSERASQRLATLERECASARTHSREARAGMIGRNHGAGYWIGGAVMLAIMVVMMAAML